MLCPYCGSCDSRVTDSRDVADAIRRRRQCDHCGARFTTYERVHHGVLLVVKKDGRREEFNRDKLTAGIRKACEKRPLPTGAIEKLVDDIEAEISRSGRAEVPTYEIGELVMDRLRELDHIAYIRFASVYRAFADLEDVRQELATLDGQRPVKTLSQAQLPLTPQRRPTRKAAGSKTRG